MNKRELKQYRSICLEIEQLEQSIREETESDLQTDMVMASEGPSYELRPIMIHGPSAASCGRLSDLTTRLTHKRAERIRVKDEIEQYLDTMDSVTASILRGKYLEGLTWRQVAQSLGKSESCVKVAVHRFFTQ